MSKILLTSIGFFHLICIGYTQTGKIVHIETAAPNVFVLTIGFNPIGKDIIPEQENWTINSIPPTQIGRYSFPYDEDKWDGNTYPITMHHKMYLVMDQDIVNQSVYAFHTPYGDTSIVYSDQDIYCESIKVNQVGYSDKSTVRYANFGVFMGDLGSVQLNKEYAQRVILNMV